MTFASDIGVASQDMMPCKDIMLAPWCHPQPDGLFDFNSENCGLEDAALQPCSSQTGVSKFDLCPLAGEGSAEEDQPDDDTDATSCGRSATWQLLCSQLLSAKEEAVPDEDLLALLLSYLKSGINSRKLATQLISRFETFGNVVSARSAQITGAAQIGPEIVDFLEWSAPPARGCARGNQQSPSSGCLGQARELSAHVNGTPIRGAVPSAVPRPPERADCR